MNSGTTPGIRVEEVRSFIASGAITKYAVVRMSTFYTGYADLPSAANDLPIGVAERAADDGEAVSVVVKGQFRCIASGAITKGDWVVIADTLGRVKSDPATGSTTSRIVGKAMTSAAATGDYVIVEIHIFERYNHA